MKRAILRDVWKLVLVTFGGAAMSGVAFAATPEAIYAEGQVWEYHTRKGDEGSLLKIQKIEVPNAATSPDRVYHITVIGVKFAGLPMAGELQHLPVSRQTLDASVTRLSSSPAKFPDPSAGIAQWRAAKGGIFTIPVADVVAFVEQTIRQQAGQ